MIIGNLRVRCCPSLPGGGLYDARATTGEERRMRSKMLGRGLLSAAVIGCLSWGGRCANAAEPLKVPELTYEKYTLPNGLTVITHEDHRLPLVAVDLWYHVGPLNERAGRTGFAHLFEHMMFEGSEHVGEKAHIKYVQGAGATTVNGTTSFDRTNYFETLPSNQLELGLWLESDRMGFLMEGLDREKLTNQRDVVRNERRQGEGTPYDVAQEAVFHLLFPKSHPYYASVIGSHADIEAARIADVRDFHQQFYTPNNASIAIAGDFNPKTLRDLLTKYFGPIPQGPPVPAVEVTTPPITSQRRLTVTDTVQLPQLQIAWLTPQLYSADDADVFYGLQVLGGLKASRLRRTLVYDQQIAQDAQCFNLGLKLTGIGGCTVTAKPGVKLEDLEAKVWAELERMETAGPTADEVEAAKASALTDKITGLQRLGGFGGVADTMNEYNQYLGDPGYLAKDLERDARPTAATVQAAARRYLAKNSAVVVYCVPGKKVVDDVPRSPADTDKNVTITNPYPASFEEAQSWRKTAPAAGPPPPFHLPVPKTFALRNGLKVYLVEDPELPVVAASLVSRAGGETNAADKAGLSALTSQMLTEGTERQTATEQAAAAERIGAGLMSDASMDGAGVSTTALTTNARAAVDLLAEAVLHPGFREADLERVRKERVVAIQQEADSPLTIARRVGPKLVYGDQPYGATDSGTVESLTKLTSAEVKGFWSERYGPGDSALVLSGDLKEGEARALAEHAFGGWVGVAKGAVTLPPPPPQPSPRIVIVDKPGAPQTALAGFGVGVPQSVANLQTVQVMNYTLGGSFASRINMNLREVHGYTYGAQSRFSLFREGGPFFAGGLVRTDATGPAAKELMLELHRIQTTPPTEEELQMAKVARVQSIPAQFETTTATASAMTQIFLYNRPLDYFSTLPEQYRAVTAAGVASAAQTDVHPDNLILLAVGDRAKIEPGLKELKLPIEYRDVTGQPVP